MSLDRVAGDADLYIGGLFSLRRKDAMRKANITHVVSVLCLPLDADLFQDYQHLVIEVNDVEDENILQHFPTSNAFIQEGLDGGGGVIVHCLAELSISGLYPPLPRARFGFRLDSWYYYDDCCKASTFVEPCMADSHIVKTLLLFSRYDFQANVRLSAMGKSRSTTVLMAYLLSADSSLSPNSALTRIRSSRPFAEPNSGFMSQLELYHRMQCPKDLDSQPKYQHWLYQRNVDVSNACGVAPDAEDIHFSDLSLRGKSRSEGSFSKNSTYRCRRCRTPLATSAYLIPHEPRPSKDAKSKRPSTKSSSSSGSSQPLSDNSVSCAHLFLDPLSWMRPELEKGLLSGRLECPNVKCSQNVGKYAWQGMKCSCGEWIIPGICITRAKVDEVLERPQSDAMVEKI